MAVDLRDPEHLPPSQNRHAVAGAAPPAGAINVASLAGFGTIPGAFQYNWPLMRYTLTLTAVLFGVWLLWSGHYDPLLITLGLVASVSVAFVVGRMNPIDRDTVPLSRTLGTLLYLPWLLREIVTANLDVARLILDPRLPIRPTVIRIRAGPRTELGRVVHANSITLTPGTVSVGLEGDVITVHALTDRAARAVQSGEMDRRVCRWEGKP